MCAPVPDTPEAKGGPRPASACRVGWVGPSQASTQVPRRGACGQGHHPRPCQRARWGDGCAAEQPTLREDGRAGTYEWPPKPVRCPSGSRGWPCALQRALPTVLFSLQLPLLTIPRLNQAGPSEEEEEINTQRRRGAPQPCGRSRPPFPVHRPATRC